MRSVKRQAGRLTFAKRRNSEAMHISMPSTKAEPVAIFPVGIGRSDVRFMRASVSLSIHWLSEATPPAASDVPTMSIVSFSGFDGGRAAR